MSQQQERRPDQEGSLVDRSLSAMLWVSVDKLGVSGINFLISVLLARLLFPEDFGVVAMALVFFEISSVFVESGFSTALIREHHISEADKSTTFIFNLTASVLLYGVLFICAPWIADFFAQPQLVLVVRVLGLNLVIGALSLVQSSVFSQRVDFKSPAKARFVSILVSGALGVGLAYSGYGVWALVARMVAGAAVLTAAFLWIDPWRPKALFVRESFRRLFGFGSRILAASILDKVFSQAFLVVIGRFFAAATLGFYTQAAGLVTMVINTLFRTIQSVSYPVLAKLRGDLVRLKRNFRIILRLTSFVIFPVLVLLGVLAEPVLVMLLGAKWAPSAIYLRLLCVAGMSYHLSAVNLNVLLVLGRSDLSLKLEVLKKINIAVAIAIGLNFGIIGLVIAEVAVTWVNLLLNSFYSRILLGYTLPQQVRDVLPTLVSALCVGAAVYFAQRLLPGGALQTIALGFGGGALYVLVHRLARTEEWRLLVEVVFPRTWQLVRRDR